MIKKLNKLSDVQKQQLIDLFSACFFEDDNKKYLDQQKIIFADAFLPDNVATYIIDGQVAGLVAFSNSQHSAVRFSKDLCRQQFGLLFGSTVYRFLKSFFEKPKVAAKDEGYIDFLCVHEEYRKQGIASKLLEYAYTQENKRYYVLGVLNKNESAKKLYDKLGYKKIGTNKKIMMRIFINDYENIMKLQRKV